MSSYCRSICFALVVFLVLSEYEYPFRFAKGDPTLIKNVCRQVIRPPYCIKCLSTDPKGLTADVRGLGGIMINCAWRQASVALGFFQSSADTVADIRLKEAAAHCVTLIDPIRQDMSEAYNDWNTGNYAGAKDEAYKANDVLQDCVRNIPQDKPLPVGFPDAVVTLRAYFESIVGIMPQIH